MNYTPSVFEQLQLDICGRLDAALPTVMIYPINPRSAGDATLIQNKLNQILGGLISKGGASGAAILVQLPEGEAPNQESPGPQLNLVPNLRIIENPLINMGAAGTGLTALNILQLVLPILHDFVDQQMRTTLIVSRKPFEPRPEFLKDGKIAYDVFFERLLPQAPPVKTPVPQISGDAAAVTITCPDGAAAIWYTVDGSYPTPLIAGSALANTAVQYAGNFAVNPGALVRAVAYNPAKMASNLAAKNMNS